MTPLSLATFEASIQAKANAKGYTQQVIAEGGEYSLTFWTRPEADLDGTFRAIDDDTGEHLAVNGWLWSLEVVQ
jgi:hypothetical protein